MPPPFKQAYHYFRHDADVWMQTNRSTWTRRECISLMFHCDTDDHVEERKNTISTIWAGSNATRAHYAGSVGTNPGPRLPTGAHNPILQRPYTQDETTRAKLERRLPDPAAPPVAPPLVPAPAHPIAPVPARPVAPVPANPLARPPARPTSSGAHGVDMMPYNFWP
jgi:hypothetical protein